MALRRVCQKYQFLIRGRTVTLEKDFIWGRHIIKHCRLYVKKKNLVCIRLDIRFLDLKIKKFECDLEWMLAICYYRGTLGEYVSNSMVREIVNEIEKADIVIAPIADNKMFYIMAQFTEGEINADVALHSLSASKLGRQFIFKTEKAFAEFSANRKVLFIGSERKDCRKVLNERSYEIDTKLKLAKREFKTGLYIEEILK